MSTGLQDSMLHLHGYKVLQLNKCTPCILGVILPSLLMLVSFKYVASTCFAGKQVARKSDNLLGFRKTLDRSW